MDEVGDAGVSDASMADLPMGDLAASDALPSDATVSDAPIFDAGKCPWNLVHAGAIVNGIWGNDGGMFAVGATGDGKFHAILAQFGTLWKEPQGDNLDLGVLNFNAVWGVPGAVYAVGTGGAVYDVTTHSNDSLFDYANSKKGFVLSSVWGRAHSDGAVMFVAVGQQSVRWGGSNDWNFILADAGVAFQAVTGDDTGDGGIYVAGPGGIIFHSDEGKSWALEASGAVDGGIYGGYVEGGKALFVGNNGSTGVILSKVANKWVPQSLMSSWTLHAMHGRCDDMGCVKYVVGETGNHQGGIVELNAMNQIVWTSENSDCDFGSLLLGVWVRSPNEVYVVGLKGIFQKTK